MQWLVLPWYLLYGGFHARHYALRPPVRSDTSALDTQSHGPSCSILERVFPNFPEHFTNLELLFYARNYPHYSYSKFVYPRLSNLSFALSFALLKNSA